MALAHVGIRAVSFYLVQCGIKEFQRNRKTLSLTLGSNFLNQTPFLSLVTQPITVRVVTNGQGKITKNR